jgi:hypothetical protein
MFTSTASSTTIASSSTTIPHHTILVLPPPVGRAFWDIVRVLGEGHQKTVFEVKLPSAEHAVAKRCNSYDCEKLLTLIVFEEEHGIQNLKIVSIKKVLSGVILVSP